MSLAFSVSSIILACVLATSVAGCGTYVPDKDPLHANVRRSDTHMSREGIRESNIISSIRCEVGKGLYEAQILQSAPYLSRWGTTVSLTMTFDEMSNASPGVNYIAPFQSSQFFSLGLGASANAHATRAEVITFTWDNKDLIAEAAQNEKLGNLQCRTQAQGILVESDLKLDQFIYDKVTVARGGEATTRRLIDPQFSVFQNTVTFVASLGGNVTPTWKLTRVSANTAGTFLGATRSETNIVLVTLGPLAKGRTLGAGPELAEQPRIQHDATFTGNAVGTAVMSMIR